MIKIINWNNLLYKDIAEMISDDDIYNMMDAMIDNYDKNGKCYVLEKAEEFFREHVHSPAVIAMIEEVARCLGLSGHEES